MFKINTKIALIEILPCPSVIFPALLGQDYDFVGRHAPLLTCVHGL